MPRILFIDKEDRTRALLQCRLKADVRIKFTPSLEAAREKLSARKFDLISWNTVNDPAAEINFTQTLTLLSTKVCGGRIVGLGDCEAWGAPQLCRGNVHIEDPPTDEDD